MAPAILIIGTLQFIIYLICVSVFIPVKKNYEQPENYRNVVKLLVSVGTSACFLFVRDESILIFPREGFTEYTLLVLFSFSFLWLVRLNYFVTHRIPFLITQWMLGICLWLSFATCIKFITIVAVAFFPVLGALVITPYFVLTIAIFEINRLAREKGTSVWFHSGLVSLFILICFQLLMNLWTEKSWELINLFSLHYNILNWD